MPEFLKVDFQHVLNPETGETYPAAWRVGVYCAGTRFAGGPSAYRHICSPSFSRRKDAEIAVKALLAAGISDVEKLSEVSKSGELPRIMCENLQW